MIESVLEQMQAIENATGKKPTTIRCSYPDWHQLQEEAKAFPLIAQSGRPDTLYGLQVIKFPDDSTPLEVR